MWIPILYKLDLVINYRKRHPESRVFNILTLLYPTLASSFVLDPIAHFGVSGDQSLQRSRVYPGPATSKKWLGNRNTKAISEKNMLFSKSTEMAELLWLVIWSREAFHGFSLPTSKSGRTVTPTTHGTAGSLTCPVYSTDTREHFFQGRTSTYLHLVIWVDVRGGGELLVYSIQVTLMPCKIHGQKCKFIDRHDMTRSYTGYNKLGKSNKYCNIFACFKSFVIKFPFLWKRRYYLKSMATPVMVGSQ